MTATKFSTERHLDIDELDRAIVNLSARINAASYGLLVLIRRFDERAGWLKWGFLNCAEWLHWRCDLSLSAAREKVRVAQQADALVTMAKCYVSGTCEASSATSDNYQVTVHVDRSALVDGGGRSGLPIESVRRLCCDGETVVIVEGENGEPLNIGRKTRTVPTAIKRALRSRDKGCVFPGCSHQRFVDAHHIQHWSAGGETSLDNLLLLCTRHHRLVHEGGFSIAKDYLDRWYFRRPDGIAVPDCGYRLEDTIDDDIDGIVSTMVNNPSAEGHSNKEELPTLPFIVAERDPPAYLM